MIRQKEFFRKVENSKSESFLWNEFSSDSPCSESEEIFHFPSLFLSKKIGYNSLLYCKTKGIFQES